MKNIFNVDQQNKDLDKKIIIALERISEAYKVLLWEQSKIYGLSPIQIQIIIFIRYHKDEFSKVSYLSEEFNVTKATVSDTIKTLLKKEYIQKEPDPEDSRSYRILLTQEGKKLADNVSTYPTPLLDAIQTTTPSQKKELYSSLLTTIKHLNRSDIISMNRMCFSCRHLKKDGRNYYCNFLKQSLQQEDLRMDCPEHQAV